MIIAVDDFRKLVETDIADDDLEIRLQGIETAIRRYCNNDFNVRGTEHAVEIGGGKIILSPQPFKDCDSIQILAPQYKDRVFSVISTGDGWISVNDPLRFEGAATIALVSYPPDVVAGVVNLMKWDISNREKIGVKSESISRWSVSYYDLDSNSLLGYPTSLLGFAKNHMRARF